MIRAPFMIALLAAVLAGCALILPSRPQVECADLEPGLCDQAWQLVRSSVAESEVKGVQIARTGGAIEGCGPDECPLTVSVTLTYRKGPDAPDEECVSNFFVRQEPSGELRRAGASHHGECDRQ